MVRKTRKKRRTHNKPPKRGRKARRGGRNRIGLIANPQQTVANLLHHKPRKAAFGNIGAFALEGLVVGLFMGALVAWGTSRIPDTLWIYAANTAIAILTRVVWAWLYVLWGRALVIKVATLMLQKTAGKINERNLQFPEGLPDQADRTVLVVTVAMAVATILATEKITPEWVNAPFAVVGIVALVGAVTSALDALSIPSNIQALLKNMHNYQERMAHNRDRR